MNPILLILLVCLFLAALMVFVWMIVRAEEKNFQLKLKISELEAESSAQLAVIDDLKAKALRYQMLFQSAQRGWYRTAAPELAHSGLHLAQPSGNLKKDRLTPLPEPINLIEWLHTVPMPAASI